MANDPSEKIPQIKVSRAPTGEWYLVEVDGGDGSLSMELRRPVGEEDTDVFHLSIATSVRRFDVKSTRPGGAAHSHEGVGSVELRFNSPKVVWPDFVRCVQALASIFDTLPTEPLDREQVREHFFKKK